MTALSEKHGGAGDDSTGIAIWHVRPDAARAGHAIVEFAVDLLRIAFRQVVETDAVAGPPAHFIVVQVDGAALVISGSTKRVAFS